MSALVLGTVCRLCLQYPEQRHHFHLLEMAAVHLLLPCTRFGFRVGWVPM